MATDAFQRLLGDPSETDAVQAARSSAAVEIATWTDLTPWVVTGGEAGYRYFQMHWDCDETGSAQPYPYEGNEKRLFIYNLIYMQSGLDSDDGAGAFCRATEGQFGRSLNAVEDVQGLGCSWLDAAEEARRRSIERFTDSDHRVHVVYIRKHRQ